MSAKERLIIIDSNSVIHRAYHALPPLTTKEGELVNAVYGFLLLLFKVLKEYQPDFISAAFDLPGLTFRHRKFREYKAKRPPTPHDLSSQIPKVKEVLQDFRVAVFEKEGFEADDVIGTIARLAAAEPLDLEVIILSGDLDTLQLVDQKVRVYALRRGVKDAVLYDAQSVSEKFQGLQPSQIVDFKALKGDASDNIPGVSGVGTKTAIELLLKFGSLDNLYQSLEVEGQEMSARLRDVLLRYKDQALLSRQLAEIDKNVPVDFDLTKCRWGGYNKEKITELFVRYQFHSLIKRLSDLEKNDGQSGKKVESPQGRSFKKKNALKRKQNTLFG